MADLDFFKRFRHEMESKMNVSQLRLRAHYQLLSVTCQSVHASVLKGTEMQIGARAVFKENMIRQLAKKPWIAEHRKLSSICHWFIDAQSHDMSVLPDFGVSCRRLTPGIGYLNALCEDNVRA